MYDSLWLVLLLMSVLNQFNNIMKRWSNVDSSRSGFNFWRDLTKVSYVFDSLCTVLLLYSVLNQFINIMKRWSNVDSSRSGFDFWGDLTKEC